MGYTKLNSRVNRHPISLWKYIHTQKMDKTAAKSKKNRLAEIWINIHKIISSWGLASANFTKPTILKWALLKERTQCKSRYLKKLSNKK